MSELTLPREDVRLLVELGFAALMRGLTMEAAEIFEGVRALRPRDEAGFVGAALALLAVGKVEEAIASLRQAPPTDAVLGFLGIAQARNGDNAAAVETLETVMRSDPESAPARMAADVLGEIAPGRRQTDR